MGEQAPGIPKDEAILPNADLHRRADCIVLVNNRVQKRLTECRNRQRVALNPLQPVVVHPGGEVLGGEERRGALEPIAFL